MRRTPKSLSFALLLICLTGCTRLQQYRTDLTPAGGNETCQTCAIEQNPYYVLGFVEFDDQGWLWQRRQLNAVIERIAEEEKNRRLLIVTFVHGWKHNAKADDENVIMFRHNLEVLGRLEHRMAQREARPERKVVGVYCGWRGLSVKAPVLKEFTFWERKNTAQEVGRGSLGELFMRLEDLRNQSHSQHPGEKQQTRLIIVGHSFGGAATYSALSSLLVQRAVHDSDKVTEGRRRFADLVMLVNPAFEAARFEPLQSIALSTTNFPGSSNQVAIAIFTSKTDQATKMAFPLGRRFSTLFDKSKSRFEARANVTAVGHFKPFITHDLIATTNAPASKLDKAGLAKEQVSAELEESANQILNLKDQVAENKSGRARSIEEQTYHFKGSDLKPRPAHSSSFPLYIVSVDPKIIPNHSTIDTKSFLRFLGQFVIAFTPED